MKRVLLLLFIFSVFSFSQEVPFSRGVNLTGWFQTSNIRQVQFTKFTKQDFLNIQSLGCDVIRLPIRLHQMTNGAPDYTVDPLFYYFMDQIVNWAEELNITLILDNHVTGGDVFRDPQLEMILTSIWTQLAEHYKDRSTYLIYEIVNEPHDIEDTKWNAIQQKVIDAIRAVDTKHTIIVTPAGWGSYNNLKHMPEFEDDNLIYSFHFYDPFVFTHQGAGWTNPSLTPLAGVPFPYDASCMPECPPELKGTWVEGNINHSYRTDGTEKKVKALIDIASNFSNERNVPMFCGEFGVYRANSDNEDRVRWYGLVPRYLSENNVPWTMWDYKGGFGLFEKGGSEMFEYDLNVPLIEAMGLNAPEQKDYIQKPDTVGFNIYTDFFGSRITEGSWGGDGVIDFYNAEAVIGDFCILMTEVGQYNNTGFNFRPVKDLSYLVDNGFALDLWLKSDYQDMKIDIRFIDTKTEDPDDHPWRMRVTVDKNMCNWDGEWHHLQIPLSQFEEHGAWDDCWYNPQGDFDWTQGDKLEIVSEHHDFTGKTLWIDQVRIVDPTLVAAKDQSNVPQRFSLMQNYPNPFNSTTTIQYSLAKVSQVRILIYNAIGQRIATLIDERQEAGQHAVLWEGLDDSGLDVSTGVYFYQLSADDFMEMRKMILLR